MKILFDTCIIIDALQDRKPWGDNAKTLFLMVANRVIDGYISAKSITDIYYLMHRCTHSDQETRTVLSKLFKLFYIIDTTGMDCRLALSSDITDYEDAVMICSASHSQMDAIVTRNIRDYSKSSVTVFTPDMLISKLSETNG